MTLISKIIDIYIEHLNEQVEHYWQIYHFDMEPNHTSHNNKGDAFKHTFMSAELSMYLGDTIARWTVYKHEDKLGNPEKEKEMDLHNDDYGLDIAKSLKQAGWPLLDSIFDAEMLRDVIANEVMQLMNANLLITKV